MIITTQYPMCDTLEEMWRIKRELGKEYPTLEAYFQGFMVEQANRKRQGVKFVKLSPRLVTDE